MVMMMIIIIITIIIMKVLVGAIENITKIYPDIKN